MGSLRGLVLLVGLVGCTHPTASGPAWPKSSTAEHDGGESLAPHESKQLTVALEKDVEKPAEAAPAEKPAVTKPIDVGGGVINAPLVGPAIEDTITTEDIIIEIDD